MIIDIISLLKASRVTVTTTTALVVLALLLGICAGYTVTLIVGKSTRARLVNEVVEERRRRRRAERKATMIIESERIASAARKYRVSEALESVSELSRAIEGIGREEIGE